MGLFTAFPSYQYEYLKTLLRKCIPYLLKFKGLSSEIDDCKTLDWCILVASIRQKLVAHLHTSASIVRQQKHGCKRRTFLALALNVIGTAKM